MSNFDTGDNKPLKGGALKEALIVLENAGYDFIRPIGDTKGTYGYLLKYRGRAVYLVARRSRPYTDSEGVRYISTQKALILLAIGQPNSIVLVAMFDNHEVRFYAYDPRELKRLYAKDFADRKNENMRLGSRMVNYEFDLGVEVTPFNIWERLEKVDMTRREREKYGQVQVKAEPIGYAQTPLELSVDVPQHLLECEKCGALYSDRLSECPTCRREGRVS